MRKYLIIDGSNLLHRSYWVSSLRKGSVPVSLLFLNSIKRLSEQFPSEHCLCVWDSRQIRGQKNFRQQSKTEYKQNRDKSKNADVFSHEDAVVELSTQLGVVHLNPGILEADDYIGWLTRECTGDSVVISSDSDLIQLVTGLCQVYNPIKDVLVTLDNFEQVTRVSDVKKFILYKSIVGDKSDNISGVAGYGLKRALGVITGEYKLNQEQQAIVDRNIQLIDLTCGVQHHPDEEPLYEKTLNERLELKKVDIDEFLKLSSKYKLKSIIKNQSQWRHVFDSKYNISTLSTDLIKLLT
jgi:DNA polymerase-1